MSFSNNKPVDTGHAPYFVAPESNGSTSSKRVMTSKYKVFKRFLSRLLLPLSRSENKRPSKALREQAYKNKYDAVFADLHRKLLDGHGANASPGLSIPYEHKGDKVRSFTVRSKGEKLYQASLGKTTLEEMAMRLSDETATFGASVVAVPVKQGKSQAMQFMTFGRPIPLRVDRPTAVVYSQNDERGI